MATFASLYDNFDGGTFDSTKWYQFANSGTSINQTGGEIVITIPSGISSSEYAGFGSNIAYDFTDSAIFINVLQTLDTNVGEVYFCVYNTSEVIGVSQTRSALTLYVRNSSTGTNESSVYVLSNPNSARWWQLRHNSSNNTVYLEISDDGSSWTTVNSLTLAGYTLTSMNAELGVGTWSTTSLSRPAVVDNFNFSKASYSLSEMESGGGEATTSFIKASYSVSDTSSGNGLATYVTLFQPLPEKDYEFRVFDHSGNFISIWQDVTSDFSYTQNLNENASELSVHISRSPDNRLTTYDALQDTSASSILDNNSEVIRVATSTANSVGPGTDIVENYNVDVYAFYGGYEALEDSSGAVILDTTGDTIYVGYGYPNGIRVYSGYIADYELTFGDTTGVDVTIVPHATELDHYIYEDGTGHTTISYASTDPVTMAKDAMDYYISQGGAVTYSTATMPLSGQTATYDFRLQTIRDVIDKVVNLLPSGYYQYVHPGENTQYLLNEGTSADHTFYYEQHISELKLKKSITQLVNDVFFIGGDDGTGSSLYKHFSDSTSITNYRRGLLKLSDSRVTTADGADLLSNQQIDEYKDPHYRTSVTINDADYDIESIRLGQMVAFANFASFVDDLLLQIVGITRNKHNVVLDLDMVVPTDTKRLYELRKQLDTTIEENIPSIPS